MKRLFTTILLLISGTYCFAQYPEASISNGLIEAKLYLPDASHGFYRATRFDWAGVVSSLKYKNHEFFGQWYDNHNPDVHDAIQGPIGIGMLRKMSANPYRFSTQGDIANGGSWKVKKKKDRIEFTHTLTDGSGYGYIYKKSLRLVKQKPELILEHSLKNTGRKNISTSTFNHNFFTIDKQPTGPDFTVTLPFAIKNQSAGKNLIKFEGSQLKYLRELKKGESTMEYPTGFTGDRVEDYDFTVANSKTGASVRITADRPLSDFWYWSVATTLSPEPFIKVEAKPGETYTWNIKYEFKSKE
jgi:hypothetical protein